MAKINKLNPLAATVGAAVMASALAAPVTAAENPFLTTDLGAGYQVADGHAEGKCGEGKCGGEGKEREGKCGEGKCGESKDSEGKCGEGKCGESKDSEGKCGEGKCGGSA